MQPAVGDGVRNNQFRAVISQRDRLGLDRVACHFSYGTLPALVSGLGSGGFIRRIQYEAVKEFINQSRATTEALRRDILAAHQEVLSLQQERDAQATKAAEWEGLSKQLEETWQQRLLEVERDLRRSKVELSEVKGKLAQESAALLVKRKQASSRKVALEELRKSEAERKKGEQSKAWILGEMQRLAQKLDGEEGGEAAMAVAALGRRRRRGRVDKPARRAQNVRRAKVRDALMEALAKVRDVVGTGDDAKQDEKRALEAVAKALAVQRGRKSITAHPELLVPERVGKKLREEGEKEVKEWMRHPPRWVEMMDVGNVSFSQANKMSIAFPRGSKPSNKDIIYEKKVLNHVMQWINPISPTPGGNGHQFKLATVVGLVIPLWLDEMRKAKVEVPIDWATRKGKLLVSHMFCFTWAVTY